VLQGAIQRVIVEFRVFLPTISITCENGRALQSPRRIRKPVSRIMRPCFAALFSISSGTERVVRWGRGAGRSHEVSQESIPVDGDAGYGGDVGLTLQLENSRASVTTGFEPVDSQRPIRRMY
jgi:hypothetical protein